MYENSISAAKVRSGVGAWFLGIKYEANVKGCKKPTALPWLASNDCLEVCQNLFRILTRKRISAITTKLLYLRLYLRDIIMLLNIALKVLQFII